jgi:hypothetical protein
MGWLEQLLRRAAPGDVPADPMAGSVMSPNYVPQTSRRQLGLGALRGLLDATPVGIADAVQSGINNMQSPVGAALRAVTGKAASPGDVLLGKLGLLGSGSGYDAGRFALNAAFPAMGLLGNQAGGALPKGYARNQSGAIVWHGSPYKFDRFDASKIGTGEGAQVYGHGLYLADDPSVASYYKKAGVQDSWTDDVPRMTEAVYRALGPMPDGRVLFGPIRSSLTKEKLAAKIAEDPATAWQSLSSGVQKKALEVLEPPGNLYKVDLPDDQIAKMLDWDKPLYRQKPEVRKAVRELVDEKTQPGTYAQWVKAARPDMRTLQNDMLDSMDNSAISEALRAKGIPGIRYLDGGSRSAGSGTSNFVVFPGNEGLLNILERNGQPIR